MDNRVQLTAFDRERASRSIMLDYISFRFRGTCEGSVSRVWGDASGTLDELRCGDGWAVLWVPQVEW